MRTAIRPSLQDYYYHIYILSCFEEYVNRVFQYEGFVADTYQTRRVQVDTWVIAQVTARLSE